MFLHVIPCPGIRTSRDPGLSLVAGSHASLTLELRVADAGLPLILESIEVLLWRLEQWLRELLLRERLGL